MGTFPCNWPFVRGIHRSPVDSPHKAPVTQSFDVFFDVCLNQWLNKQWRCQWFGIPWHCHVIVMSSPTSYSRFRARLVIAGGCFTNIGWSLQNILSKFAYCTNCTSYVQSHALGTAQSFNLKFSPQMWFLALYNFMRLFWRAHETLVKHPPQGISNWIIKVLHQARVINGYVQKICNSTVRHRSH